MFKRVVCIILNEIHKILNDMGTVHGTWFMKVGYNMIYSIEKNQIIHVYKRTRSKFHWPLIVAYLGYLEYDWFISFQILVISKFSNKT